MPRPEKLFNQAALPSPGQGETLHRRMKRKERERKKETLNPRVTHMYGMRADTHVRRPTYILLISWGAGLYA